MYNINAFKVPALQMTNYKISNFMKISVRCVLVSLKCDLRKVLKNPTIFPIFSTAMFTPITTE